MKLLAKVIYGSQLYGTSVPESDMDYRSIYLPAIQDLVLQRAKDAWEYEDKSVDDTSVFSLQHFCRLACEGQSIAVEMLAAPPEMVVETSLVWMILQKNRRLFYTKSMHSFLGFSKTMAAKYSTRVDRLAETEAVLKVLGREHFLYVDSLFQNSNPDAEPRLAAIWDKLPVSLNAEKTVNDRSAGPDKRVYRVCGREIQATVTVEHAYKIVKGIADTYGERVRRVKEGQIEYKSLAHAFRAALQCKEIVETGDLRFPLKDAEWLRSLRLGQIDFAKHSLDKRLDDLIAEVQDLMDRSDLPEKADRAWVDSVILEAYGL